MKSYKKLQKNDMFSLWQTGLIYVFNGYEVQLMN